MSDAAVIQGLRQQLESVIVGQTALLDRLIVALVAGGHVLLEGPPGLAKTTAVHALASSVSASFQRIQFTPDLMPGDLTGSEIYEPAGGFRFVPGPLFHEIVLADEINRAPPKVQSALLEAMAEHQITVGGHTRRLPELFMVLATQNPLEQSGTYPLPEAQLDRFLFHVVLDYPSVEEEIEIARRARRATDGHVEEAVQGVIAPAEILAFRRRILDVYVDPTVERYAVELVAATRDPGRYRPEWRGRILAGASPRGSIALLRAAMARAWLAGRDYVLPDDVMALAPDVLRHRLVLDFAAEAEGVTAEAIVQGLLEAVPAP
jgi:MoxR-like ATPase